MLTKEQVDVLSRFGLSIDDVFDASDHPSKPQYYPIMKEQGKTVAVNTTPCRRHGHQMRTRNGHCILCNNEHLVHALRAENAGYLYVFECPSLGLVKVGFSTSPVDRLEQVQYREYAGTGDWCISYVKESKAAGRAEIRVHKLLEAFRKDSTYQYLGNLRGTRETYACTVDQARNAIAKALRNLK